MKIIDKQILELRKEIEGVHIPRSYYKNKPLGCPFYGTMNTKLQNNFDKEELQKAFVLGLIGNNGRKGTIINNSKL